jgi:hypothetical protein
MRKAQERLAMMAASFAANVKRFGVSEIFLRLTIYIMQISAQEFWTLSQGYIKNMQILIDDDVAMPIRRGDLVFLRTGPRYVLKVLEIKKDRAFVQYPHGEDGHWCDVKQLAKAA